VKTVVKIGIGLLMAFMLIGTQGCQVQKNEFVKKKYKIRKGMPPAQRYYNKYSIFRPKPKYPRNFKSNE
jgi:hypothetical protein